jgi:hypothetical protein
MPRKPTAPAPAVVEANAQAIAQLSTDTQQLHALQAGYGQGRDLVNQLLGQAQAFQAAGNLLQTFGVSKLVIVKENKLYQQLAGSKTPNGLELRGTWEEFCSLLGISDEKANQDIANLQQFGEEALEQMQRAGIGYRDLRQFRKLPSDQKTELIEAAKGGDKDTLLELAEDLIAKHAKEKETLSAKLEDSQAEATTALELAGKRNEEIVKLKTQLKRIANQPLDEQLAETLQEVAVRANTALGLVRGDLREGFKALAEFEQAGDNSHRGVMRGYLDDFQRELDILRADFFLLADPV